MQPQGVAAVEPCRFEHDEVPVGDASLDELNGLSGSQRLPIRSDEGALRVLPPPGLELFEERVDVESRVIVGSEHAEFDHPLISDNYFCRLATIRIAGCAAVRTARETLRS